jgi:uncharacterized RDD family membrane protein YckC
MSAPTPANGDSSPTHGFYPDPSIPGYVRYWNGSAWVPGTSRPAPAPGEPTPMPPPGAAPAAPYTPNPGLPNLASVPAPAPGPAHRPGSSPAPVEETGPFFFDEEEQAPEWEQRSGARSGGELEVRRPAEPAPAWQADTSRQNGFGGERDRRVSWGSPAGPVDGTTPAGPAAAPPATTAPPGLAPAPAHGRTPAQDPRTARSSAGSAALPARAERPALEAPSERRPNTRQPQTPQAPAPTPPRADHTVSIRTQRPAKGSVGDGTMAIRAVKPPPQQTRSPQTRSSRAPQQQGPQQQASQQQTPQQTRPQTPAPAPAAQRQLPPQGRQSAPGASTSWAQQVHQLSAPAGQQGQGQGQGHGQGQVPGQDEDQPVVPWKPPVEDHFTKAAREQAAARPAGLGRRLAARLIDTVVLGALIAAVAVPLVLQAVDHIDEKIRAARLSGTTVTVYLLDATTVGMLAAVLGAFLVIGVLYEALPTAKWGRTLGKKVCGLQVRAIEEQEPPRFGGALRRWLVYGVLAVLGIGVLNVLWCLVDRPWRQCWHDKAARTFVTKG